MSEPTQTARVLRALERAGRHGICQADFLAPDVIDGYKPITRLAARIADLEGRGYEIARGGLRSKCRVYRLAVAESAPEPPDEAVGLFGEDVGHAPPRSPYESEAA